MTRSLVPRLNDILRDTEFVASVLSDKSPRDLEADMQLRLSVERAIEIASEAVQHIPRDILADYPLIPWWNIKAIGSKLRHECDRLDADSIWDVATHHLPGLRSVIETIKSQQHQG